MVSKTTKRKVKNSAKSVAKAVTNPKNVKMAIDYAVLASKVAGLVAMVNAEKKQYNIANSAVNVGQVNANVSGFYAFDMTPLPAQGTTASTRNGNSIKLHSSFLKFQIFQQAGTSSPVKFKIYICAIKGNSVSVGTFPSTVLNPNTFVTGANIYDLNSDFDPDYFPTFRIVKTVTGIVKPDNITSQTIVQNLKIPLKYNGGKGHHVRFPDDASTSASNGQLVCFIVCDTGNMSGTTVSTLSGVFNTAINTGVRVNYNIQHYYYDN